MPINKSYGQEMDKRTRELDKRSTGKGTNALQEQQLAQNQLQAIQNEQRSNLMSQRTEAAAMAQQNQLLSQAAELGVDSSTAATLGKYGLKSPPRVQRQQGRQVNVTPNKITVINNTNTTTNNQYQGGGGAGDNGSATKFKTWLNKVNMQQAEQASKRDRDYARRESSLTRSANKMLRRIEKVGSSVAESFSPQNFGQTLGSQLKTYLLIFGMRFLTKYWDKILDGLGWFQDTFTSFVGWLGIGEKGKQMANEGKGLVPTIVKLFGGDPKRENVSQAFTRSMKAAFDHFSLKLEHMYEQRAEAIKNVKSPFDGGKAKGLLGEALKDSGIDELFSGISTYLGDILTALVNPKAGVKNNIANSVRETGRKGSNKHKIDSTADYKSNVDYGDYAAFAKKTRRYGMDHNTLTENGRDITNNRGAAVFQSLDILGAYQDAKDTGYVDPARVIAGLERLQKKARSSGFVVVDPDFINQMFDLNTLRPLMQAKHIRGVNYKLVEEERTEWEKRKAGESISLLDNAGWYVAGGAAAGSFVPGVGTALGAGIGGAVGAGVNKLRQMSVEDNTLKLVPMTDSRPAVQVVFVYEVDEYALRTLARKFGSESWDAGNKQLIKMLRQDLYSKAGGYAATKRRYRGRGSNESINVDETFRELDAFDQLAAVQKTEEDTDEYSIRQQRGIGAASNMGNAVVNTFKSGYKTVAKAYNDNFVKPGGGKTEVHYSPTDYVNNGGVGQRTSDLVKTVNPPVRQKYEGIRIYSSRGGMLKTPRSTSYTFSTKTAAEEAERLCNYIITNDTGDNRQGWQKKSPGAQGKTQYTAVYTRLAIARGLNMNDLPDHPARACDYADYLYLYGFSPIDWNGYSPRKGDICVYGPTRDHPNGYISLYTGAKWASDFLQTDIWPYDDFRAERCATVFRHLSAVSNKSSNEIAGGEDMTSDAIGYIDFDGDGVFDAVRTPDGTIYKMDEAGNIGDRMSIETFNSSWNSETSSISYMGDSESGLVSYNPSGSYEGPTHIDEYTINRSVNGNDKWVNAVTRMGDYYRDNIHTYHHNNVHCTLEGVDHIRPDCSGFVSACLVLYGIDFYIKGWPPTAAFIASNSTCAEKLRAGGFVKYSRSQIREVRPFDILVNNSHTEIVAEKPGWAYNCGSRKTMESSTKMPSPHQGFVNECTVIWRHESTPSGYGTSKYLEMGGDLSVPSWDASPANYSTGGSYNENFNYTGGGSSISSGGVGSLGKISSEQQRTIGTSMINFFRSKGLTHEQALGIAANLFRESSFNPTSQTLDTDGKIHKGLAQWNPDWWAQLASWAKKRGLNEWDASTQLEFIWYELEKGKKAGRTGNRLLDLIRSSGTAQEAAFNFGKYYEVFGGSQTSLEQSLHAGPDSEWRNRYAAINTINEMYGTTGLERGINFTSSGVAAGTENPEGLPALPENIDNKVDSAIESVKLVFNNVTDAIKDIIPGLKEGKTEIITHDDKANEKIKAMSDDQLAAQIWNTNANIRSEYSAIGFESWRKNQFGRLSRKDKQRYLVEEEGKNILKSTSYVYLDENGRTQTGSALQDILGVDWDPNTPEGQNKFALFYASLSPKDRRDLSARLQMGKSWGEIRENILETTDYNRLGYSEHTWKGTEAHWNNVDEVHKLLNAVYFNPKSTDNIDKTLFQRSRAGEIFNEDDLAKAIQLGNIEKIKEIIGGNKLSSYGEKSYESILGKQGGWGKKEGFKVDDVYYDSDSDWDKYAKRFNTNYIDHRLSGADNYRIHSYNDYATRMLLAMTQTPELYQKYQKNIADIIGGENFDKLRELSWDVQERMGDDFKKLPGLSRRKGKVADILGIPEDEVSGQDVYDQLVKFRGMNYDIAKNKYIQLHLTDDFLNIDENTSAQDAYYRQQVNRQLAEKNQRLAEIEYARGHRHLELEGRTLKDKKLNREIGFNYGVGYGAYDIYDQNEGKKELDALDKEYTDLWAEKMQLLGEGDKNTPERLRKLAAEMKEARETAKSGTVISDERQKRLADYATTPEEFRRKYLDEHDNDASKDKWLEKHVGQYGIKKKEEDEYEYHKPTVWELMKEDTGEVLTKTGRKIYSYEETEESKKAYDEARKQVIEDMHKELVKWSKDRLNNQLEDLAKGELSSDQLKMLFDQAGIGGIFGDWKKFTSNVKKNKLQLGDNLISIMPDGTLRNNLTNEAIKGADGENMTGIEAFDLLDKLDDSGAVDRQTTANYVVSHTRRQARNKNYVVGYENDGSAHRVKEEDVGEGKTFDPKDYENKESYINAIEKFSGYLLDEVEKAALGKKYDEKEDIAVNTISNIPGVGSGKILQIDGVPQLSQSTLDQLWNNTTHEAALYGFKTDQAKVYDEMKFHANLELQQKMKAISSGQLSFDGCMLDQLITLNSGMVKLIGATQAQRADLNGDGKVDFEDLKLAARIRNESDTPGETPS